MRTRVSVRMFSQLTFIPKVVLSILTILILYTSLASFIIPLYTFSQIRRGSSWEGWANVDTIFSLCVPLPPYPP